MYDLLRSETVQDRQTQPPRAGVVKRPPTRRLLNAFAPDAWRELEPLEPRVMMAATPIDSNDQIREAVVAGVMSTTRVVNGVMDATTDVDVISFNVSAGQTIALDIDRKTGTLDSHLRLFNASGTQLAYNDNAAAPGEIAGQDSYLTYTFSAAGRYYIAVSTAGNTNYSALTGLGDVAGSGTGTYRLTLSGVATAPADTAGNTLSTARNLGTIAGAFSLSESLTTSDKDDFYKFTVGSAMNTTINLSGLSANADLQFIADANGNGVADPGEVLASGLLAGTGTETMQKSLTAGTYFVRVYNAGANTNYALSLSLTAPAPAPVPTPDPAPAPTPDPAPAPGTDWFSTNLFDNGIVTVARSLFTDGSFSRGDVINILSSAGSDDGIVNAQELGDLRKIVANASTFGMEDYVKVLASKIVNGSTANATYLGTALGNLASGSGEAQLDKLVGKWFLGADHPIAKSYSGTTTYTYQAVAGAAFQNGVAYTDIRQGNTGDCYLLATLGSIALDSPSSIQDMLIDNGDNTFTVRFYHNGAADYVTVDRYLPVDSSGRLVFANMGSSYTNAGNELWVPLIEKAYAQANEMKWIGQDGTNSYQGISGGWMGTVYTQMLNKPSSTQMFSTEGSLASMLSSGKMVTAGSKSSGTTNSVVSNHAYIITGYNSATKTFTLYNPWGSNQPPALTFAQLTANFGYMAVA